MLNQDESFFNRNGQLAPSQAERVNKSVSRNSILNAAVVAGLALLFIGLGLFFSLLPPRSSSNTVFVPFVIMGSIGIIMLLVDSKFVWDWWRLKQDVGEGRVLQGDGMVEWQGNKYRATVDGRALQFLVASPPNHYRFYYLPRTGYIVSAEAMMGSTNSNQSLQEVLATVFKFDLIDLQANRQGQMSDHQAEKLWRNVWVWGGLGLAMLAGGFIMIAVILSASRNWAKDMTPISIMGIIDVFVVGLFAYMAWREWRDIVERRLLYAEGTLTKYMRRTNRSTHYYLVVAERRFSVGISKYNSMIEGKGYRIHFTPRAKTIVAVEVLQ